MNTNKKAAIAAAEALGGVLCWAVGNVCGSHIASDNGTPLNVLLALACCALQAAGLWLFTNVRERHARRMGYLDGERDAYRKADETMREFLTERAVFVIGQMPERPKKPTAEKAN